MGPTHIFLRPAEKELNLGAVQTVRCNPASYSSGGCCFVFLGVWLCLQLEVDYPVDAAGPLACFYMGGSGRPARRGGGRPSHVASNVSSMCNCHAEEGGKRPQSAAAPGADLGTRAPGCSESRKGALLAKAVNYDASTRATGGSPQAPRRLA